MRISFYCQLCLHIAYKEFVFVTKASTVQQSDSEWTKNTDNKENNLKIEQVNKE